MTSIESSPTRVPSPTTASTASTPLAETTPLLIKPAGGSAGASCASSIIVEEESAAHETRRIIRLSAPIVLAYLLNSLLALTSLFAIGPLGPVALGAAALGNMFCAVSAWGVLVGIASALDTLCSQAYTNRGGAFKTDVGIYVQRGLAITSVVCLPVSILWYFSDSLMIYLAAGDVELGTLAAVYVRTLIPELWGYAAFETLKKFLQAQSIMSAATQVLLIVTPLSLFLSFFLVDKLGFYGAPLTNVIIQYLSLLLLYIYTVWIHPTARSAWGGINVRAAFSNWYPFLQLAGPGILMVCAEWWAFEFIAIAASHLGREALAAQSIILNVSATLYMIPLGIAVAASTRIGNLLGAGNPLAARRASRHALAVVVFAALINTLVLVLCRHWIGRMFTDDASVLRLFAAVIPICALYQLADGVCCVCGGILRGMGRQAIGAVFNLVGYYILALPLGVFLAFADGWRLGLQGLWWGILLALLVVAIGESTLVWKVVDWDVEVQRCKKRLNRGAMTEESEDLLRQNDDVSTPDSINEERSAQLV